MCCCYLLFFGGRFSLFITRWSFFLLRCSYLLFIGGRFFLFLTLCTFFLLCSSLLFLDRRGIFLFITVFPSANYIRLLCFWLILTFNRATDFWDGRNRFLLWWFTFYFMVNSFQPYLQFLRYDWLSDNITTFSLILFQCICIFIFIGLIIIVGFQLFAILLRFF